MKQYFTGRSGDATAKCRSVTPPFVPNCVPTQFGIGTTQKFTRSFRNFPSNDPASQWTLTIYWNGPLDKFNKQAEAVSTENPGPGFFVWLKPADTAGKHAGAYRYCERLTNAAGDKYDVTGDTLVSNLVYTPADAPAGSFQTFEEQILYMLQQAVLGNKTPMVMSYQIAGRAVQSYPMEELYKLLGFYKSVVWRQQHPGQLGVNYEVAFTEEPQRVFPIPGYYYP